MTAPELLDELESQLEEATRRASTRAEHLRLTQIRATAARLRSELSPSALAEPA